MHHLKQSQAQPEVRQALIGISVGQYLSKLVNMKMVKRPVLNLPALQRISLAYEVIGVCTSVSRH